MTANEDDELRDAFPMMIFRRARNPRALSIVSHIGTVDTDDGHRLDIVIAGLRVGVRYGSEELYVNLSDIIKHMSRDILVCLQPKEEVNNGIEGN